MKCKNQNRILLHTLIGCLLAISLTGCNTAKSNLPLTDSSKQSQTIPNDTETVTIPSPESLNELDLNGDQLATLSKEYSYWVDDGYYYTVNEYGTVLSENAVHFSPIKDLVTKEILYYSAYYKTYDENSDGTYDVHQMSRLYTPDGMLVKDWDETVYADGVSDWVLSYPYRDINESFTAPHSSCLLNPKTGEKIGNIYYLEQVDDTHLIAKNNNMMINYIFDSNLNELSDFSEQRKANGPFSECFSYNEYLVACKPSGNDLYTLYFYNPDGKLLGFIKDAPDSYLYSETIIAPYISCDQKIYNPSEGTGGELTPLYTGTDILYCDSTRMIDRTTTEDDYSYVSYLYDLKTGQMLSNKYDTIYCECNDAMESLNHSVSYFIGTKGDRIDKLNRDGKVLNSITIKNLCNVVITQTGIICATNDFSQYCLLNLDFEEVIPIGKYTSINTVWDNSSYGRSDLLVGQYYIDDNDFYNRLDIFASDGTMILKGASEVGSVSNGKLAVSYGLSYGIIDTKGNWILKIPKHVVQNAD